jgi:glycerophosphoryl diester phosphodiesterase
MRFIGHAGLALRRPGGAPDRASLDRALTLELDRLEVDVAATADRRLVLRHDLALPSGRSLEALSLDQARAEQPDLLTLDEATEHLAGRLPLLLDLKGTAVVEPLAAWLSDGGASADSFAVCTDEPDALVRLREAAARVARWRSLPRVPAGPGAGRRRILAAALRHRLVARLDDLAAEVGATALGVDHWAVTGRLCSAAHRLGLPVVAWTVNSGRRARAMAGCGVDMITSDEVARVRAALLPD